MSSQCTWLDHAKVLIIGIIIGVAICIGVAGMMKYLKPSPPSTLAQPAPELKGEVTKKLACKDVVVFPDKVEHELGLPDAVTKDPSKHVAAATQVEASDSPTTVSAVYDDGTGRIDLFKRQDPQSWLDFNKRAELGVAYLFKDKAPGEAAGGVIAVDGRITLLKVKALRAGLVGQVDSAGGWQAGGRIWGEWR